MKRLLSLPSLCLLVICFTNSSASAGGSYYSDVPHYDQNWFDADGNGDPTDDGGGDCLPTAGTMVLAWHDTWHSGRVWWPKIVWNGNNSYADNPLGVRNTFEKVLQGLGGFGSWSQFWNKLFGTFGNGLATGANLLDSGASWWTDDDKFTSWSDMKGQIDSYGPLFLGIYSTENFYWGTLTDGAPGSIDAIGGHAVCMVGYSEGVPKVGGVTANWMILDMGWFWESPAWMNYDAAANLYTVEVRPQGTPAQPPSKPVNPSPGNYATGVSRNATLSWSNGGGATSYNVYFGTINPPGAAQYTGNQSGTTFNPGTLANDSTYYWRVDAMSQTGPTQGDVWTFSTESSSGAEVTLTAVADTFVDEMFPSANRGGLDYVDIFGYMGSRERALIRFSTSSIPSGSTINSVELRLYSYWCENPSNVDTWLGVIGQSWGESTATWNSQPSVTSGLSVFKKFSSSSSGVYHSWLSASYPDLKTVVSGWVNGTRSNYGFLIEREQGYNGYTGYRSREWGTSSQRPRLIVNYTPPQTGALTVYINPADVRAQGAQWRLTNGPDTSYHNSGETVSDLPTGSYTLYFSSVTGWNRPQAHNTTITIATGSNSRTDTYGFNVSAPSGVSASDGTYSDRIRVEWTASPGATEYEVWRNDANTSASATRVADHVAGSPYHDYAASVGQSYYYWVKAKNAGGTSGFSSSDSGYRQVGPPSAPTGVSATDGTYSDKVHITWNSVSGATSYEVWRHTSNSSGSASKISSPDPTGTSYDDTSAVAGTTYYYWVKAKNAGGTSGFSSSDAGSVVPLQQVDTPAFTPDGGTHSGSSVSVTIACDTPGATIRYKTDGGEPTAATPTTVASGGAVWVPVPGTLKAKAWKDGMAPSDMKPATYSRQDTPDAGVDFANIMPPSGTTITNGATVAVSADVLPFGGSVIQSVSLLCSWAGGVPQELAMPGVGGVSYAGTIPPLAAGTLSCHVRCVYRVADVTYEAYSANFTYTVSETLLSRFRYTDFASGSWTPSDATQTDYTYQAGDLPSQWWIAQMAKYPLGGPSASRPPGSAIPIIGLRPVEGAFIRTPLLQDGVGTVYFASVISDAGCGAQMAIQYTTNNTPDGWQTAATLDYDAIQNYRATNSTPVVINNRAVRYVRFVRLDNGIAYDGRFVDLDSGLIYIDNIYVSQPPTGVTITEELHNPGYPAQDQEVRVRCRVTDVDDGHPSVNRRVQVFYSWQSESGPWSQSDMALFADNVYEGVIPQHDTGTMYYYFLCDFDGYYYSRDPDGPGPQPTYNESRSPALLVEKGEDNYRNYEIRRYRSDVQVMRVLADRAQATVNMELVGDHLWQGMALVTGIANLNWSFVGMGGYTNDAARYGEAPWVWGDNDQDFPYPPLAGYAERDSPVRLVSELEYDGFLMMRLDCQSGGYIVKRAAYQNFDVWPASPSQFMAYVDPCTIQSFNQDFGIDAWTYDSYGNAKYRMETVDDTSPTDFARGSPMLTGCGWTYDQTRVVKERNTYEVVLPGFVSRRAIELGGVGYQGHVSNTYMSETEGVDTMTFKARLSLNDNYCSFFSGTFDLDPYIADPTAWPLNYRAEATFRAATLSPGMGSLSILTRIRPGPDPLDPLSYYETRLSQGDPTTQGQERLNLEVYRWKGGAATKIGSTMTSQGVSPYLLTGVKTVRVGVSNAASQVTITVSVDRQGRTDNNFDWGTFTFADTSADRLTEVGTVGFISYDAQIEVQQVRVMAPGTARTANLLPGDNWVPLNSSNWYMGGQRADGQDRWRVSGTFLLRDLPMQTLGIYRAPMPEGAPTQPDPANLQRVTTQSVTGLGYTTVSIPMKLWNKSFVVIKNEATGEINAVVDDLALSPWRAVTRSDKTPDGTEESISGVFYYNWNTRTQQDNWVRAHGNTGWLILEGWVNASSGSKGGEVQFDRTRANTNLAQALISPYLTNNIGSITFDWRASGVGDVVFAVERTANGAESTWVPVLTVTNVATSGSESVFTGTDFPGRFRVRVAEGTKPAAVFKIDNLIVRDYPPRDDTTWVAYNTLISSAQPGRAFEPAKPGAQTAYLNNDPTDGVPPNEVFDAHLAFIQTPAVGTGIGEIAFWYRIWDTAGGPGMISLQVAPSADTPDEQWKLLTSIVVDAEETDYAYFHDDLLYEPDNKVVRIVCHNTGNRVCIDNVLVAEPVCANFEITSLKLLPEQPLVGQPPGLEVEIGRFRMLPEEIRVFASYYVGTNVWGFSNWWSAFYPHTVELELVTPRVFRTPHALTLPAGAIDDVVQFVVFGVHRNIHVLAGDKPIFQGPHSFVTPSWYYPVDLNEQPAKKAQGWSPYYFVYSCPPRSVWVNEICYRSPDGVDVNQEFIEIIGPAEASLGNWKLQMVNIFDEIRKQSVVNPGFLLKNTTNDWGFLVWGDAAVSNGVDHILIPGWAVGQQDIFASGGIRVIRSNGAWEDRVSWGAYGLDLQNDYGYTYAGQKTTTVSLSLETSSGEEPGSSFDDFVWSTAPATPGQANTYQELKALAPPTVFFMVFSAIGPNGAHSFGTKPLEIIAIPQGGSTNLTYAADEWCRIAGFLSNGATVSNALGKKTYEWTITDVLGNVSNHVTFAEAYPGVSTGWLSLWGADEAQSLDASVPSMDYAYMLDINPWLAHDIAFTITGMTVSEGRATITVKLTDYGVGHGPINGQVAVYARESLSTATWGNPIAYAAIGEIDSNGEAIITIEGLPGDALFFKAVISRSD